MSDLLNEYARNLTEYAENELTQAGLFNFNSTTGYNRELQVITESVMELIEIFAKQGHNEFYAQKVIDLFNNLVRYKNLTPLTFKNDEWVEVEGNRFQNKRNPAVFKDGGDGRPYYLNAYNVVIVFAGGEILKGIERLRTENGEYIERCYIKDPFNIPTIEIVLRAHYDKSDVIKSKWIVDPITESQLEKIKEYYDVVLRRLIP